MRVESREQRIGVGRIAGWGCGIEMDLEQKWVEEKRKGKNKEGMRDARNVFMASICSIGWSGFDCSGRIKKKQRIQNVILIVFDCISIKLNIFVNGLRLFFPKHIRIKKKRCAYLVERKPEKFLNCVQGQHSGSHAIAWAAITTSVHRVSQDLRTKTQHCSATLLRWLDYVSNKRFKIIQQIMRKLIVSLAFMVITLTSYAQCGSEHHTFKGIPIEGSMTEFCQK